MSASSTPGPAVTGQDRPPISSESPRLRQVERNVADPDRFFAKEGVDPLTQAFEGKLAVHPGLGGLPVRAEERGATLEALADRPRTGNSVAYIHVPFCETHCLYCGFYNRGYRPEQSHAYTDTLIRELALWQDRPAQNNGPLHAVYFGGGTPTALDPDDLLRLLREVRDRLPLANDCEITIEGRSSNLTAERIEACLEGGANRFSLGVQSFHTEIRRSMGRRSSRAQLLERLGLLQSYNQAAVVVDLIYGFPGQTMEAWLEDIAVAQSLELDGADCYQLNIYASSLLAKSIAEGKLPSGADIPQQARMFAAGVEAMQRAFYRRLSISHWGRTPRERNLYNQYVKGGAQCLAFGPGAGGSLHGHFLINTSDYAAWQRAVEAGRKPVVMLTRPLPKAALFKAVAENLEQGRLDLPCLERRFTLPLGRMLAPLTGQWERAGLVCSQAGSLVLTMAGQFWQVNLSQLLLEYLNQSKEFSDVQEARRAAGGTAHGGRTAGGNARNGG